MRQRRGHRGWRAARGEERGVEDGLRRQRSAPRDDPAARGARRPGAGVETKSGGAHDGGRHGSCGDSMLNAHQGAPRRSDDVAARVRSQKLGTTRINSEAGAHTAADHVASEPLVRSGPFHGLFLVYFGVCAVRTKNPESHIRSTRHWTNQRPGFVNPVWGFSPVSVHCRLAGDHPGLVA